MTTSTTDARTIPSRPFRRTLRAQFLVVVGAFVLLFSGFVLFRTWSHNVGHIDEILRTQTELAIRFDLAIREYIASVVRPFADGCVDAGDFIPEVMSTSFVARSVFDQVRTHFPDYIIKFSSDNPRNPQNMASPEEHAIIEYFRANPAATQWSGRIAIDGEEYRAHFVPRRLEPSCLRCHGDPQDAPRSLLVRYGDTRGFNRAVGDVVALDTVAIPTAKYQTAALHHTTTNFLVLIAGLCLLLACIYWAFHALVSRRLRTIATHFAKAVDAENDWHVAPIENARSDEIGDLVASFNALNGRIHGAYATLEDRVAARTDALRRSNEDLQAEIAERVRAEEALRASESRLTSIVQAAPVGIGLVRDRVLIWASEQLLVMTGYRAEELIGKNARILYPTQGEYDRVGTAGYEQIRATGTGSIDTVWRRKDGTPMDVMLQSTAIDRNDLAKGITFTALDITERKRVEGQRSARLQRIQLEQAAIIALATHEAVGSGDLAGAFKVITETVAQTINGDRVGIWKLDYDAGELRLCDRYDRSAARHDDRETLKVMDVARYLGNFRAGRTIDAEDAPNDPRTAEFAHGSFTPARIASALDAVVRHDGSVVGVVRVETIERRRWQDDETTFIGEVADQVAQALLSSERREAAEALRRAKQETDAANRRLEDAVAHARHLAEEATIANRTKGEFLANMSHEIRTPLHAILGFGEMLSLDALKPEQRQSVDIIRESGENLLRIINDILDFSKIEAGKLDVELVPCSLAPLLHAIELLLEPAAAAKGLAFSVACGQDLPADMVTDPDRLRQCVINLVGNAIKFTDSGHVRLGVTRAAIDGRPAIRFDIEDTGIGIPRDRLGVLFTPFTQADGSTTRRFGGTGLGLAITKRLIELLGGSIEVSSEQDKGSVFSLLVPLADFERRGEPERIGDATGPPAPGAPPPRRFSGRVLVAEDTPASQRFMAVLLRKLGFDVTLAADGTDAVRAARADEYAIIFMDIQMPVMNGYDATRALRASGVTTPIIALTACALKGDDRLCLEAGCDAYVPKPVNRARLIETIERCLAAKSTPLAGDAHSGTDTAAAARYNLGGLVNPEKEAPMQGSASSLGLCSLASILAFAAAGAAERPETVTVKVGEAIEKTLHRASGFLHGFSDDGALPPDPLVLPLKIGLHRTRPSSTWSQAARMKALGIEQQVVMSDGWGYGKEHPGDNGHWRVWEGFIETLITDARRRGLKPQWDIWNEPDHAFFWKRPPRQFLEAWGRAHAVIRRLDPRAAIVGPSWSGVHPGEERFTEFLDYAAKHNVMPDYLCWHFPKDIVAETRLCREILARRKLTVKGLMVNEYCLKDEQYAGRTAWLIAQVERAGLDGACHAVWGDEGKANLDGIIHDSRKGIPRGQWWVYERYAAITGHIVATVPGEKIDLVAGRDAAAQTVRVLLGNAGGYTGTVTVVFEGLQTAPYLAAGGKVRVVVERIPQAEGGPVAEPSIASEDQVPLAGGTLSIAIPWTSDRDAYAVRLAPPRPPVR